MAIGLRNLGQAITGAITRRIEDKLCKTGEMAVPIARSYAPIRTGFLRSGISYEVKNRTLTIISAASYSVFQDRGTRSILGHFFLEKALAEAYRGVWGGNLAISFPNTPSYHRPVHAHKGGYVLPGHLTRLQRLHIATRLLPASRAVHANPHVRRARLIVGHPGGP